MTLFTRHYVFSTVRPLPDTMSPAAVLSLLHNHLAMIDMNPLVVSRQRIKAPDSAQHDKKRQWYSVTDRLLGGLTTIEYRCSMQDRPDGLRTWSEAPLGVEIGARWTVQVAVGDGRYYGAGYWGAGQTAADNAQARLRHGRAPHVLCLREDVDLRCNLLLAPFIKHTLLQAHAALVEHMGKMSKQPHTQTHTQTQP